MIADELTDIKLGLVLILVISWFVRILSTLFECNTGVSEVLANKVAYKGMWAWSKHLERESS